MAFARLQIAEQKLRPRREHTVTQRDSEGVSVAWEFGQHLLGRSRRMTVEAKELQRHRLVAKGGEAGIGSEPIAELFLPDRIAVSLAPLQTFQRFTVPSHPDLYHADEAVADELVDRVVLPLGHFNNFTRERERGLHPRRYVAGEAQAEQHGEALQVCPDAGVEELFRRRQGRDCFRCSEALKLQQRVGAGEPERQFEELAVRPVCQTRDQRQAAVDIVLGFQGGRAR